MDKYKITLDNEDGTYELVKEVIGTEAEARKEFEKIIDIQSNEYHVKKTLKTWRVVRLFNPKDVCIAKES